MLFKTNFKNIFSASPLTATASASEGFYSLIFDLGWVTAPLKVNFLHTKAATAFSAS